MQNKQCNKCNEIKNISDFGIQREKGKGNFRGSTIPVYKGNCKQCTAIIAKEWRKQNPDYYKRTAMFKVVKEDKFLLSAIRSRITEAKQRVKRKNGIPTNITDKYMYTLYKQQQGLCALSGQPISLELNTSNTLSIDQIQPSKGYIEGNVQWVTWAVNRAKGDLLQEDFISLCSNIQTKCRDYRKHAEHSV